MNTTEWTPKVGESITIKHDTEASALRYKKAFGKHNWHAKIVDLHPEFKNLVKIVPAGVSKDTGWWIDVSELEPIVAE